MSNISLNYAQIIDPLSFKSINLAKIYIGEYGTLPNPANAATWKQAYFVNSDGTRTAASQPIRTNAAGYAVDGSGNIKTIQVDGGYSLLVQDQYGATKFSQARSAANSGAVLEFDTIAGFTGALDGSVCYFKGRDTVGDGFGGPLRFLAGSTITPSGDMVYAVTGGRLVRDLYSSAFVSYMPAGAGAVQRTVQDKSREFVSLADFGGVGDWNGTTGTDNTLALNNALAACEASGLPLYVGPGRFYFAGLVTKAQSFTCPTIFGAGKAFTEFVFGGAVGFKIKGGSGTLCGAEVYGIKFSAVSNTTKLVQVADQCGLTFRRCGFGKGAIGLELVNESSGGFTEFVIADDCDFEEDCAEALVYTRIDGTDSFHGSGLRSNCTINESATETKSKIRIGGTGSSTNDIIVYNAPLSFQIWKRTTLPVIDNNTTRFATNFHGNITLELSDAAGSGSKWPFADDAQKTYFVGGMSSLQDKTLRGSLVLCDTFESRADGTVSALLKPYRAESVPMVSGDNTICTLQTVTTETYLVTVRFADSAGQARKVYLLAVNFDPAGAHTVTTIAQLEDYFGGNMPYPTFTVSGSSLIATATFATTVSAYATISKIGIGDGFGF